MSDVVQVKMLRETTLPEGWFRKGEVYWVEAQLARRFERRGDAIALTPYPTPPTPPAPPEVRKTGRLAPVKEKDKGEVNED